MSTYTIVVPDDLPPAANRRERQHWAMHAKTKKQWVEYMAYLGGRRIPQAKPGNRRRVSIHLEKGSRGKYDDEGNLDYRSKVILDALVELQILWDDDPSHLDYGGVQQTVTPGARKQTKVEVTIP